MRMLCRLQFHAVRDQYGMHWVRMQVTHTPGLHQGALAASVLCAMQTTPFTIPALNAQTTHAEPPYLEHLPSDGE
jgi:hypothetical protein